MSELIITYLDVSRVFSWELNTGDTTGIRAAQISQWFFLHIPPWFVCGEL